VPLRQRLRFMVRHIWAILGFSAGIALVCLVPCGLFLVLPAGVVGATILVSEIERAEAAKVPRLG
jgi:uncharacterized protein involved in cysteine biosynthesis